MPDSSNAEIAPIVVTEEETRPPDNPSKDILLDPDKKIWITAGVPIAEKGLDGERKIEIPNSPYVFKVDELIVRDKEHNPPPLKFKDVTVLLSHGKRVGNRWKFGILGDGQDVADTVEAYSRYVGQNNIPDIEFVVCCNKDEPNELGVKIGEFEGRKDIAYAVGEEVGISDSRITDEGKIIMAVSVNDRFFGLDDLVMHRSVKI